MARKKLILICQSGGEFVTNDDGTMSYNGGEANAVNVTGETLFNDLKLELAEACDLDQKTVTIKYFLPGYKKNLIVVKNDKDVKRMIDFHANAITADVFLTGTTGFDRSVLDMQSNRGSCSRKDETLNHDNAHNKKDKAANRGRSRMKKDDKVPTSPPYASPGKRTRSATAAAVAKAAKVASSDNQEGSSVMSDGAKSVVSVSDTSSSASSGRDNEKSDSDSGSDYRPRSRKRNRQSEVVVDANPADAVKKKRQTPTWKFGANGRPTIVPFPDNKTAGSKSQRKSSRLAVKGDNSQETKSKRKRTVPVADDSDQEPDNFNMKEIDSEHDLPHAIADDYAFPETMVDEWKSAITGVGQEFDSVNEFRAALKKYAIANRFGYKFKKNDTSRARGGCAAEGCSWRFYAVWVPTNQSFMIKTLNDVHTCDKSRTSTHPAKNWLVGTIKDRLRKSPYLKPKEIANGLSQDFGVELSYTQVWRGIGDAREQLHGSHKESYNKLPWFCEKLVETNPGSIANLVIGDKKRFKSLFVSFYALIRGFQNSCRPLIFLDAASLKSRYGEILLTAIAIDGNECFFPVAFAIVDVEDDDNWHWFLEQLKTSILNSQPITFVVDRDKNLKNSVLSLFEDAHVGYSIHHLTTSFKKNMKGPFHGDGKAFLTLYLLAAAHAVRPAAFKRSVEQIKLISSQAYDWVMQIEPEHWATSSFKGERYNYITEDVGESYAKILEEYRHLPILQKIDALIRTMIDDMEYAKQNASMWSTQLTALKEKEFEAEKVKAHGLKVWISSDTIFEVREDSTHVVNVSNWSCTCNRWKESGLPCRHAIAVFSLTGKNPYDFCSGYFKADAYRLTYAESIHPIPINGPPLQDTNFSGKQEHEKQVVENDRNTEKEEGIKENSEMEGTSKEEGETMEVQKDERINKGNEKDEGIVVDVESVEGAKLDAEKNQGSKFDAEKVDGSNVDAEKDEGCKLDAEKDEVCDVDVEKEANGDIEAEKEEGCELDEEKEESKMLKLKEEHVDPNVFVLPPIAPKQSSSVVKNAVETENEMKRNVTCSKCKQSGHSKKSCTAKL